MRQQQNQSHDFLYSHSLPTLPVCALEPDHDLTKVNTPTGPGFTWSLSANSVLVTHRAKHTHCSRVSCTGISSSAAGHSVFKLGKKKNVRGRCLAVQHNLVLVSLLLTYHLTIWNDPRQLSSSRRIFRQRSAKPNLAHSYHPYHSYWANAETTPAILPFLDKILYLEVLPSGNVGFPLSPRWADTSLLLHFQMSKTFLRWSWSWQKCQSYSLILKSQQLPSSMPTNSGISIKHLHFCIQTSPTSLWDKCL